MQGKSTVGVARSAIRRLRDRRRRLARLLRAPCAPPSRRFAQQRERRRHSRLQPRQALGAPRAGARPRPSCAFGNQIFLNTCQLFAFRISNWPVSWTMIVTGMQAKRTHMQNRGHGLTLPGIAQRNVLIPLPRGPSRTASRRTARRGPRQRNRPGEKWHKNDVTSPRGASTLVAVITSRGHGNRAPLPCSKRRNARFHLRRQVIPA